MDLAANTDDKAYIPLDNPSVVRLQHTQAHTILGEHDLHLYLSPAHAATNETAIKADGITHILNITKEIPKQQFSHVQVCQLQCYDSPQQKLPFEEAATFIQQALLRTETEGSSSTKCLVHCHAGKSRSASVIIYYLMTKGHTLRQSYQYVKARKPDICPNFGFCSQLQEEELKIFGNVSLDMDEYKADTLLEILEGSGKTREDVFEALKKMGGDGELALGMLLE